MAMAQISPVKVGLVGAGMSATTFHAPFLKQSTVFNVTGILRSSSSDPVPGLEKVPVYTDLQEFLAGDQELVIITTPTHTHYRLAKSCLQARKHVILEKPMAASYAEAKELCSIARSQDKLLAVYHNRRWDGDFLTASALIKCGVLGRLVEFESHFDRYRPALKMGWKEDAELPSAGVLYDLGLVLNQRHLPVCSVHDAFTITLQYDRPEGPLMVLLRSASLCKIPGPRFTLHGTQGSWVKHGMDVQEEQLRAGMNPMQPGFGAEQPDSYGVLDSQALELNPALQAPAPAGPLEPLPEVPEAAPVSPAAAAASVASEARDSALEAATAAAMAGRVDTAGSDAEPAATVSSIAAAVLAKIDAGASAAGRGSAGGSRVKVVTQQGCWHKFYEEIGGLLLSVKGQGKAVMPAAAVVTPSRAFGEAGTTAAAAAAEGVVGSRGVEQAAVSTGLRAGINSQLTVEPEAAAEVIRVIELAAQSSEQACTLAWDNSVQ